MSLSGACWKLSPDRIKVMKNAVRNIETTQSKAAKLDGLRLLSDCIDTCVHRNCVSTKEQVITNTFLPALEHVSEYLKQTPMDLFDREWKRTTRFSQNNRDFVVRVLMEELSLKALLDMYKLEDTVIEWNAKSFKKNKLASMARTVSDGLKHLGIYFGSIPNKTIATYLKKKYKTEKYQVALKEMTFELWKSGINVDRLLAADANTDAFVGPFPYSGEKRSRSDSDSDEDAEAKSRIEEIWDGIKPKLVRLDDRIQMVEREKQGYKQTQYAWSLRKWTLVNQLDVQKAFDEMNDSINASSKGNQQLTKWLDKTQKQAVELSKNALEVYQDCVTKYGNERLGGLTNISSKGLKRRGRELIKMWNSLKVKSVSDIRRDIDDLWQKMFSQFAGFKVYVLKTTDLKTNDTVHAYLILTIRALDEMFEWIADHSASSSSSRNGFTFADAFVGPDGKGEKRGPSSSDNDEARRHRQRRADEDDNVDPVADTATLPDRNPVFEKKSWGVFTPDRWKGPRQGDESSSSKGTRGDALVGGGVLSTNDKGDLVVHTGALVSTSFRILSMFYRALDKAYAVVNKHMDDLENDNHLIISDSDKLKLYKLVEEVASDLDENACMSYANNWTADFNNIPTMKNSNEMRTKTEIERDIHRIYAKYITKRCVCGVETCPRKN